MNLLSQSSPERDSEVDQKINLCMQQIQQYQAALEKLVSLKKTKPKKVEVLNPEDDDDL